MTTPAVHPRVGLIPNLTAILAAILPGSETVLWAPIVLCIQGGGSRQCEQHGSCNLELSHHTTPSLLVPRRKNCKSVVIRAPSHISVRVPELTRSLTIKLNERVWLRR